MAFTTFSVKNDHVFKQTAIRERVKGWRDYSFKWTELENCLMSEQPTTITKNFSSQKYKRRIQSKWDCVLILSSLR